MRRVAAVVLAVCCAAPLPAAAQELPPPWYGTALIGMEVGPTGAQFGSSPEDKDYAGRFDGRAIVEQQVRLGSDYLVIWARDGEWAYYDSKHVPKAPGLGERDAVREAVEAAKPHRLPVVAYVVVQQGGAYMREHPEYRMRGADGNPIDRFCLNSPGYLQTIEDIAAELLDYRVNGFHIDMIDQGFGPPYGCFCDTCKALFEEEHKTPMPSGATWDAAWDRMLEFRYKTSERFERAVFDHIKGLDPNASVDFNYHGYPPFSFEVGQRPVQHAHVGDFVTCESGVWGFGALSAGLTAEFVRASGPTQPFQVVMQRGVRFYHDQTTRPLDDLRWEMFALLAHGAQVTVVDKTPYLGMLDPVAYDRLDALYQEVNRKRDHFRHRPVYDAGLFFSARTRDWYARETPYKYFNPFFGAHKALATGHLYAGVLLDENLDEEALLEFPVVVLASTAILHERELALLRAYVEAGGRLIVTGLAGAFDGMGAPRSASTLEPLIGARLAGSLPDNDNYVRFGALDPALAPLAAGLHPDWPHLVYGPAAIYEPTTAAPVGELLRPVRTWRMRNGLEGYVFPSSAGEPAGPALLVNRIGKGTVLTIAASPDNATASEYRTVEARTLLVNAVRFLNPEPRVRIEAPRYVEATVTGDPAARTLRVHLVAYTPPPGTTGSERPRVIPEVIEDNPIYRARIVLRERAKKVRALDPATRIDRDGDAIGLMIENLHETIVCTY